MSVLSDLREASEKAKQRMDDLPSAYLLSRDCAIIDAAFDIAQHADALLDIAEAARLLAGAMSDSEAASIGVLQSKRRLETNLARLESLKEEEER